jgi:hypothetical protein
MKRNFIAICLLLFFSLNLSAQSMGEGTIGSINSQLRSIMGHLEKPNPNVLYFYDMAAHVIDDTVFKAKATDTLNTVLWYTIYEELYYMAYDTTTKVRTDTLLKNYTFAENLDSYADTVDFGMMAVLFASFKDSMIMYDTTFFTFDTVNNKMDDKIGRPDNPIAIDTLFAASALMLEVEVDSIVFRLKADNIFKDQYFDGKFEEGDLEVNFNDGSGWQAVDHVNDNFYTIQFQDTGLQLIEYRLTVNSIIIAHSKSTLKVARKKNEFDKLDGTISIDNGLIKAGIFKACNADDWTQTKLIIYLSGFDPLEISDNTKVKKIEAIYDKKIKKSNLAELRNHGYTFLVVAYKSTHSDVVENAMAVVSLLESLKCATQNNPEQFVVIGSSLGAIVGRYALTYMEKHAHPESCAADQMHKTRLFISLDGVMEGANIPLAFQYLLEEQLFTALNPGIGLFWNWVRKKGYEAIHSVGARQLLLYHRETENHGYFSHSSLRANFISDLHSLNPSTGGYPEYCKLMATTNGLLTGEKQLIPHKSNTRMTDGQRLIYGEKTQKVKAFFKPIIINHREVEYNLNGAAQIYNNTNIDIEVTLKIKWVMRTIWFINTLVPRLVVEVDIDTVVDVQNAYDVVPYCSAAGGNYGAQFIGEKTNLQVTNPSTGKLNLNLFNYSYPVFRLLFSPFYSSSFEYYTDGLAFCFTPVPTTMSNAYFKYDIAQGYTPTLNTNFVANNSTISDMLDKTPFHVVAGEYVDVFDNLQHGTINNHQLLQANPSNAKATFYMNREIGDDTLYLENIHLNRNATFSAKLHLVAGPEANTYYYYPKPVYPPNVFFDYETKFLNHNAIFSKDLPFYIDDNKHVSFLAENDVINDGDIELGRDAGFTYTYVSFYVCDNNYTERPLEPENQVYIGELQTKELQIFPNPVSNTLYVVFANETEANISILSIDGKLIKNFKAQSAGNNTVEINIQDLYSGMYIIKINSPEINNTYKLIKY